jgi:hypothetical protein
MCGRQGKAGLMRNLPSLPQRRVAASLRHRLSTATAATAIVLGVVGLAAAPALAVGTNANTISASSAPGAGSTRGSYTPTATASSGDKVVITLDKSSSGCSLSDGKVTFTGSGTCVVDFNDPGNSTYAAAAQVQHSTKVYSSNTISTSAFPSAASAGGSYAPGATATSGDSVVMTLDTGSSGCTLNSGWIDFKSYGTCKVNFNDPGNGAFAAASQVQHSVTVHSSNTISASTPPGAGAIHQTYTPTASATSGDKVAITLNSESTGCSLSDGKVTFNDNGVCVIDFNDPGNGAFAAASEVRQSITIGTGNPKTQGSVVITTTSTGYGRPLVLSSTGGSGSGAVSYAVTSAGYRELLHQWDHPHQHARRHLRRGGDQGGGRYVRGGDVAGDHCHHCPARSPGDAGQFDPVVGTHHEHEDHRLGLLRSSAGGE